MARVIFINKAETLMVNVYCQEALADIIAEKVEAIDVSRRPIPSDIWGPPVPVLHNPARGAGVDR